MPVNRVWLLLSLPAFGLSALLLALTVRHFLRVVRGAVVASVPFGPPRAVDFETAGAYALFVEGPRLTPELATGGSWGDRSFVLTRAADGLSVPVVAPIGRTRVSGFSRVRLERGRFDLPTGGTYLLGVDVQRVPPSPRAAAGEVALVVARPITLAIVTHVLALVVLGVALIASIVVSIVAMSGAPLTSS